jgi:hypothetical protein
VNDNFAKRDAAALFRFLIRRGYIAEDKTSNNVDYNDEYCLHIKDINFSIDIPATPLSGVDMIEVIFVQQYDTR